MQPELHISKADQLRAALAILYPDVYPAAVAELAMVCGTHLVNVLCHLDGVEFDIVHSDLIRIDRTSGTAFLFSPEDYTLRTETLAALRSLHRIEVIRRDLVRGERSDPADAAEAVAQLEVIQTVVGRTYLPPVHDKEYGHA